MRLLLVMWLALGLAPGLGEVVEAAVHFATAGHLSHSDADHGDLGEQDCDRGCEQGCGTTGHHCGCCAPQVVAMPPVATGIGLTMTGPGPVSAGWSLSSIHQPAPPYRPPIAA